MEGLNLIDAFATLTGNSDVTEMAKRMTARTANAGQVILGTMQIKKIQALVYWVKDHHKRNLDVDPHAWTETEVMSTMQRKEADQNFEKVDVDVIDPGKCQVDAGWDAWQIAFVNKLSARERGKPNYTGFNYVLKAFAAMRFSSRPWHHRVGKGDSIDYFCLKNSKRVRCLGGGAEM